MDRGQKEMLPVVWTNRMAADNTQEEIGSASSYEVKGRPNGPATHISTRNKNQMFTRRWEFMLPLCRIAK